MSLEENTTNGNFSFKQLMNPRYTLIFWPSPIACLVALAVLRIVYSPV
jgi:hypothetical protein